VAMCNFQHQSVCGIYLKTSSALKQLQRVANDIGVALYESCTWPKRPPLLELEKALTYQCQFADKNTPVLHYVIQLTQDLCQF